MLKAVIFDMDGVIIDSEPFHWEVNKQIFKLLGIRVSKKDYRKYIGSSNTNMWTDLKARFGLLQPLEDLVKMQVNGNIDFLRENQFGPIEGITGLLRGLKKNAVAIGLASSSPDGAIDIVLRKFKIENYFSIKVSGEDFKKSKPAPDIFLRTARLLRVPPAQCVVIEDSAHGVAAARAAGMKCVGFANKNSWDQDLSKADLIIDDLRKLNVERIRALFS
jgi:haloacid dehalogenase superfamily, subfamily IA, variant 3 with third motif having DD or ED/haloacid dehalogenase superfamily, subfamily IA, variant 1 with third motif having Dx(3-4)D or Dx(3-4)E